LILNLANRRGDAIALGRQHLKPPTADAPFGLLRYTQEKNRRRKPQTVTVPIDEPLAQAIAACPSPNTALTFLTNTRGRPFTPRNFNDCFRACATRLACRRAAWPTASGKGRRASSSRAAAPWPTLWGLGGWRSLKDVQKYAEKFNRERATAEGIALVAARRRKQPSDNVVPLPVAS
jgi:hypothetical protein